MRRFGQGSPDRTDELRQGPDECALDESARRFSRGSAAPAIANEFVADIEGSDVGALDCELLSLDLALICDC